MEVYIKKTSTNPVCRVPQTEDVKIISKKSEDRRRLELPMDFKLFISQ